MINKLWKHQQALVDLNPKKWLLAWDMGIGKTITALTLVKNNQQKGGAIYKCLIVCPKSLKEQWQANVDEFIPQNDSGWKKAYTVMSKEEFKKWILETKKPEKYSRLIVDEIHTICGMNLNPKQDSMLFKTMYAYIEYAKPEYIYLLTGTPYTSSPLSILALGLFLGRDKVNKNWSRWVFKKRFFYSFNIGRRKVWQPKKNLASAMNELINKLGNIVSLEDTLTDESVPEQLFTVKYFDLTKEQKDAIKDLTEEGIARWSRQLQIESGTLKSDGYEDNKFFKNEKLEYIKTLLDKYDKFVIVCKYNLEIEMIKEVIKDHEVFVLNGKTKNKFEECNKAEASDKAVVLIQANTSMGFELPSYSPMVFYSRDFSLVNGEQMIKRILRKNKLKRNLYINLVIGDKKSTDYHVYKNIFIYKRDFQWKLYGKKD